MTFKIWVMTCVFFLLIELFIVITTFASLRTRNMLSLQAILLGVQPANDRTIIKEKIFTLSTKINFMKPSTESRKLTFSELIHL